MMKRIATLTAVVAMIGILVPATALAKTIAGHVTAFTPTSLSVLDKEIVTVGINRETEFTRLITHKPWQADTHLTFSALRVGAYAVVHVPDNGGGIAAWVQIATDGDIAATTVAAVGTPAAVINYQDEAAHHRAEARMRRASPNASESKRPGSPDTALHCERLADRAAGKAR